MRLFIDYCPVPDKLYYTTNPVVQLSVPLKEFNAQIFQQYKTIVIQTQEYRYFINNKWISQFIAWEPESNSVVIYERKQ